MFDGVGLTRHITENYTDFLGDTLVEKTPVPNWPKLLGEQAAELINTNNQDEKELKVLIVYGGVSPVIFSFYYFLFLRKKKI